MSKRLTHFKQDLSSQLAWMSNSTIHLENLCYFTHQKVMVFQLDANWNNVQETRCLETTRSCGAQKV